MKKAALFIILAAALRFTKIGVVQGLSQEELKAVLSGGNTAGVLENKVSV